MISASCGGRGSCGKCKVQIIDGKVSGDIPDSEGMVRACAAIPLSDITIACPDNAGLISNEVAQVSSDYVSAVRAGIALDIGTTTISARLIDMDTSAIIDTICELNDQRSYGADVMSRINFAGNGKTEELYTAINRQTDRIIRRFMERRSLDRIEELAVSGNTVMLHLFLNIDPSGMARLPFTPAFLDEKTVPGRELSLPVEKIIVLPSISAFIGADISADLAVIDILNTCGPSLLIDIGTNGEMALFNKGAILCCSTAAGPAFEGAEISCGMGGIAGAISGVHFSSPSDLKNGALSFTVIGNVAPKGICGSGLIDAIALMLKQGIIDASGSMTVPGTFSLAPGVSLNARDIRQFQTAKSAIYTGITILCGRAGLSPTDIQRIYIAGGLGFFINKYNAAATGIFPYEFASNITVSGNLSLQGAQECLCNPHFIEKCRHIKQQCTVIDLATDPSFMDEFAANMLF